MSESLWEKKNNISFPSYLNFCAFDESKNFETCDVILDMTDCTLEATLLIVSIKMKWAA